MNVSTYKPRAAPLTLIGHPFATVGMGEQLRSYVAACRSVHLDIKVLDIFKYASRLDAEHRALIDPYETQKPEGGIRIFHVNGDEVDRVVQAFDALGGRFKDGYNIIVPAWELPRYPATWAKGIRAFDEVWALSKFIRASLAAAKISSTLVGQPVEAPSGPLLPRKYFGIQESAFAILHFFDLTSYATRKNPEAVLRMFELLRRRRPYDHLQLVLKVKKGDEGAEEWVNEIQCRIPEVRLLVKPMNAMETRSLVNSCDCFVSLHRSEGFGRGTGEAMSFGRLAVATAWSGNLDYMTKLNSLLIDYKLIKLKKGDYPHCEGQHWAEPDIDQAVNLMDKALAHPDKTATIAAAGRRDIRRTHSYRAIGLRILDRVIEISGHLSRDKSDIWRRTNVAPVPSREVNSGDAS